MSVLGNLSKPPKGFSQYSLPAMGPGQTDIYGLLKNNFMQGGGNALQNLLGMAGGDQSAFSQLEAPMMQKFQREILPGIANRYSGSGISSSSGMQNAMATAATDFGTNMQAQRMNMMQQSIRDVLGLGEHLLGTPTQQFGLVKKDNIVNQLMQLLGMVGGGAASGLAMGAML